MTDLIILSGCSGGGKSTLLSALDRAGYATVPEPGRRVLRAGGPDPLAAPQDFARACLSLALEDLRSVKGRTGPVFFDRSAIDALANLAWMGADAPDPGPLGYHRTVLFAPPWPEIFVTDAGRRHGFDAAVAEHDMLSQAYPARGHDLLALPKLSVAERVAFVRAHLAGLVTARNPS